MNTRTLTSEEIRTLGLAALTKALGPSGAVRFLRQFQHGSGDYTANRSRILGNPSVDDLIARSKSVRRRRKTPA